MTLPVFPTLPGQAWSVKKAPLFSTRVASHVSGREVRAPLYAHGLYTFELTFDGLDSNGAHAGLVANSLQTLMGFFIQCQGQANPFLYIDPSDSIASATPFGAGDGATTSFLLTRPLGGAAAEVVSYVQSVSAVTVGGSPVTGTTLQQPNTLVFPSAPGSGQALKWSGVYGFQCRFSDDALEFENFMSGLWSNKSVKFRSLR